MIELYLDDLLAFFEKGGVVLYVVFVIAFFLWGLLIERYIYISFVYKKEKQAILESLKSISATNRFKDEVKRSMAQESKDRLQQGLVFIKLLIIVCPLVGLLGTVTGMIAVFDVMAIMGTSDVKAMANGVSMATIPTMAGLVIALSGILFERKLELSIKYRTQKFELELSKAI